MSSVQQESASKNNAYLRQIMSDMKNGVLALDTAGNILYSNPQMNQFFEKESLIGETVHALMYTNDTPENDEFWDIILSVTLNRSIHYQKKVKFRAPSGKFYSFHMTSSYLCGEANGIVITIADETEYDVLVQKKHDATLVLLGAFTLTCLSSLITEIHVFVDGAFPHEWIARSVEIISLIMLLIGLKFTTLSLADFGIFPNNLKKELTETLLVAGIMVLGMSVGKIIMIQSGSDLFSPDRPFFDFTAPPKNYYFTYIIIVFLQELLTKCGFQKSISKILEGKYRDLMAILIASMLFMAIHVQHGLVYMIGAGLMSAVLAVLYSRHDSLLGCGIVHYTFGIMGIVLQWIK